MRFRSAISSGTETFTLTTGVDYADDQGSTRNGTATDPGTPSTFKFTDGNEVVSGSNVTLQALVGAVAAVDTLLDNWTTDNDVLNLTLGAGAAAGAAVVQNIETINLLAGAATTAAGSALVDLTNFTGVETINVSGSTNVVVDLTNGGLNTNIGDTGVTTIDASGLVGVNSGVSVSSSTSTASAALTIKGGAGADTVIGGAAGDTIDGNGGADLLVGANGNDTINGGAGDDVLGAQTIGATTYTENGNDTINGGEGDDTIDGGAGIDNINRAGSDCLDNSPRVLSGSLPGFAERGVFRFCRGVGRA